MKKPFCCDASRGMYEDYYMRQSGGQMPVFAGSRHQRGHGIGSILSGMFRHILPFLKANGKNMAVNLLRTGIDVADDVFEGGKKVSDSLKDRVPQGIKRTFQQMNWQTGSGRAKKRKCAPPKRKRTSRKRVNKRVNKGTKSDSNVYIL